MRRGRGLLISGSVVLVLSLVAFGVAVWVFVSTVRNGVEAISDSPAVTVHEVAGAGEPVELRPGSYVVYGTFYGGTVLLDRVEILGPDGAHVPVRSSAGMSVETDDASYRSVASFQARTAGRYLVVAVGREGSPAVVGPGIGSVFGIFGGVFSAIAVGCLGVVVFVTGAGLLIGGAVVSTRSPKPGAPHHQPWP